MPLELRFLYISKVLLEIRIFVNAIFDNIKEKNLTVNLKTYAEPVHRKLQNNAYLE